MSLIFILCKKLDIQTNYEYGFAVQLTKKKKEFFFSLRFFAILICDTRKSNHFTSKPNVKYKINLQKLTIRVPRFIKAFPISSLFERLKRSTHIAFAIDKLIDMINLASTYWCINASHAIRQVHVAI